MSEVLPMSDIEARYDGEWVLLGEPEMAEDNTVRGGRLLWHSKDRDEVYQAMLNLSPRAAATLFVGSIPDDRVIIL